MYRNQRYIILIYIIFDLEITYLIDKLIKITLFLVNVFLVLVNVCLSVEKEKSKCMLSLIVKVGGSFGL